MILDEKLFIDDLHFNAVCEYKPTALNTQTYYQVLWSIIRRKGYRWEYFIC